MDDMYNNPNNQNENGYGGPQSQSGQPSIQAQLQYQYQAPRDELEEPMTMGEWLISLLITMIPCAGIVMVFVWAFSSTEKKSKSNFFKAYLIFLAISFVIVFVMLIVAFAAIAAVAEEMGGYYY